MKKTDLQTIRAQLDAKLLKVKRQEALLERPSKGWLQAVRVSLGLNVRQFAERMKVDKSRISRMERDELTGSLTIHSLRHAAELLGCDLVYALVPKTRLEDVVKKRAREVVGRQLQESSHTMALEDQALDPRQKDHLLRTQVERFCKETPKQLWERS